MWITFRPWVQARQLGITVAWAHLPQGMHGRTDGRSTIELGVHLSVRAARCTLGHELIHIERGHVPPIPPDELTEASVDAEAVRRLVPLESLEHGWAVGMPISCLATTLLVTPGVLRRRLCMPDAAHVQFPILGDRCAGTCSACPLVGLPHAEAVLAG